MVHTYNLSIHEDDMGRLLWVWDMYIELPQG